MSLEKIAQKESLPSLWQKIGNFLTKKTTAYALAFSLTALVPLSCGNDNGEKKSPPAYGCKNKGDCKGDRICVEGDCVSPSNGNGGNGNGQQCDSHARKVCSSGDVYWENSCGKLEEMFEDCGSNEYCNNGRCVEEEPVCDSHVERRCYNDDVYWYDSCGDREGKAESCEGDEYCSNGQCIEEEPQCYSHTERRCSDGDVYWYDSCGNKEERYQDCTSDERCEDGSCIEDCVSRAEERCVDDDWYWYDSCGNREEQIPNAMTCSYWEDDHWENTHCGSVPSSGACVYVYDRVETCFGEAGFGDVCSDFECNFREVDCCLNAVSPRRCTTICSSHEDCPPGYRCYPLVSESGVSVCSTGDW